MFQSSDIVSFGYMLSCCLDCPIISFAYFYSVWLCYLSFRFVCSTLFVFHTCDWRLYYSFCSL